MNRQPNYRLQATQNHIITDINTKNNLPQDASRASRAARLRNIFRSKNNAKVTQEYVRMPSIVFSFTRPIKRSITLKFQCQICDEECKETRDIYVASCEHKGNYCESCLHEYTIYRINQFQEVTCPSSDCGSPLETDGKLFRELPAQVQKKYEKIQKFYLTLNDPNAKMCPLQNCEGIIRREGQSSVMCCSKCESRFCSKCLMREHLGDCDEHQIIFLQRNLNYRRCVQCKMIIEKNQGCNHMTCRCGHQFCYVCGAKWHPTHYNPHDQYGIAVETEGRAQQIPRDQNTFDLSRCVVNASLFIFRVIASVIIAVFIFIFFCILLALAVADLFAHIRCLLELAEGSGQCSANLISRIWSY